MPTRPLLYFADRQRIKTCHALSSMWPMSAQANALCPNLFICFSSSCCPGLSDCDQWSIQYNGCVFRRHMIRLVNYYYHQHFVLQSKCDQTELRPSSAGISTHRSNNNANAEHFNIPLQIILRCPFRFWVSMRLIVFNKYKFMNGKWTANWVLCW